MKRPVPQVAPVHLRAGREPLLELELKVVTPMFGGSDTPGEVDPELPVRGSTVRGHLRFWWRACVAHRFASAEQLFASESELWGATSGNEGTPSALEVEVEMLDHQRIAIRPCACYKDRPGKAPELQWLISDDPNRDGSKRNPDDSLGYALFPFRGEMKNRRVIRQPSEMAEGVSFRLRIFRSPSNTSLDDASLRRQVEAAVWAWITFGGIGARTRRGCGTLWTSHPEFCPPANTPVRQWLQQRARQCLTGDAVATPLPIPRLKGARVLVRQQPLETNRAWREAVNWLRGYRQRRTGGATGRSLWPEAQAIRALTGRSARGAPPPPETPLYFPRGELGLPIIFHFKDQSDGDPPDQTLQAAADGATRMASPFITKALAINEREGWPMVVWLNTPRLAQLGVPVKLIPNQLGVPVKLNVRPVTVHDPKLAQQVEPLRRYNVDNPVDGFVEFIKGQGQIEEVRLA